MSKYKKLWDYIKSCDKDFLSLTFDEIGNIAGTPIDHSFLRHKKELAEYGWEVRKNSLKEQEVTFEKIKNRTLVLYIHGKGGTAKESEHYKTLFPYSDVSGLTYKATTPWEAKEEFSKLFERYACGYNSVFLIANSIGAYFSMCALPQDRIKKAYFISPIVDMEKLIFDMMNRANITKKELREKETIETTFGETLSYKNLCYVKAHPISWNVPTAILYGDKDNLTSKETIFDFSENHNATLTVMENGEHWFHTKEQIEFLDNWIGSDYNDKIKI